MPNLRAQEQTIEEYFKEIYIESPECRDEWRELDSKYPAKSALLPPRPPLLSGVSVCVCVCVCVCLPACLSICHATLCSHR